MKDLKKPAVYEEQLTSLKNKGFIIADDIRCINFLKMVNYYRLEAYYLHSRKKTDAIFTE